MNIFFYWTIENQEASFKFDVNILNFDVHKNITLVKFSTKNLILISH